MIASILLVGSLFAGVVGPRADTLPLPAVAPLEVLLPAELVAARVREVLRDHTDAQAWQGLAGTLPDMIVRGGADIESIFEAARLADEMSGVSADPTAPLTSISAGGVTLPEMPQWFDLRSASALYDNGMAFVAWVAMALLGVLLLPRLFRGGAPRSERLAPVRSRLRIARALAGKGRSIPEISRESRLAREALSVLLQPHGG